MCIRDRVLCNGQNGTPDLRNRFVIGAGDNFSAGDTAYTLGSAVLNSSLTSVGTLTGLTVAGNVLPSGTTRDLGSSSARWANIYSADLQLSNEGKTNDVDGTWGNYTIQEGESELFLINNRNGKKYKFNLTEVS